MPRPRSWLLLTPLLFACATTGAPARVAWPAPPSPERIRLVKTVSGGVDVEGPFERFWRKLAGAEAPAHLYHPVGVAVSRDGRLLAVTDQGLSKLFLFDLGSGALRVVDKEQLGGTPIGVAVDEERVWVVVPERRAALAFGPAGEPLQSLALDDCERPTGLAVDSAAKLLYVADTSSAQGDGHQVHVHALDTGEHKAALGKKGSGEGELFFPTFVSVGPQGGVYVADTMNARVLEFDEAGASRRQFGERGDQFGQFDKPKGIATDSFGNVYVVDSFFSVVQIFNREGRLLLFFGGRGDSPGFLSNPAGIAIDGQNRIYVANGLNFRVDVYELVNTEPADSQLGGP